MGATVTDLTALGVTARRAADALARCPAATKNAALCAAAASLRDARAAILAANSEDVAEAVATGTTGSLLDRLTLTDARVASMAAGIEAVAALPDPVGETMEVWRRPNGLEVRRVRVPLGVIAVIYEARPNVTSDVAALCIKSGNAAILRGSSATLRSNTSIVDALVPALDAAGLPAGALQLVSDPGRDAARALMRLREVDLLIPRGGKQLIADIRDNATVPFVIDGDGNCHVYVDVAADLDKATSIVVNAKTSRPSVCNAAEKLLVHRDVATVFLPRVAAELSARGVELRGDEAARGVVPSMAPATDDDWGREYLDLIMAIAVVDDVDGAIDHIRRHTSGHTEAIVTEDETAARRFVSGCPSAVVMVNASTRFTDGGEFGYGAEIGNSTQRLHARGPMGLRELTTYRLEVWGDGQIRA
jgi:glutamate-5-semialdehyde dehydrogenase